MTLKIQIAFFNFSFCCIHVNTYSHNRFFIGLKAYLLDKYITFTAPNLHFF